MDLNNFLILSTTLTNLVALYPIYKLYKSKYLYGAILITLSMTASIFHHISLTSETNQIKGLILTEYSNELLFVDKLFAYSAGFYGIYLFSYSFKLHKLSKLIFLVSIPVSAFVLLKLSGIIIPVGSDIKHISDTEKMFDAICEILFDTIFSNNTKLILFIIFHNIWHILAFYSLAKVIPY